MVQTLGFPSVSVEATDPMVVEESTSGSSGRPLNMIPLNHYSNDKIVTPRARVENRESGIPWGIRELNGWAVLISTAIQGGQG